MSGVGHDPKDDELLFADDPNPSVRVIGAVASATDTDPVECPSLNERIDPGALDDLFGGRSNARGRIVFEYAGYTVTVDSNRNVTLTELDRR